VKEEELCHAISILVEEYQQMLPTCHARLAQELEFCGGQLRIKGMKEDEKPRMS